MCWDRENQRNAVRRGDLVFKCIDLPVSVVRWLSTVWLWDCSTQAAFLKVLVSSVLTVVSCNWNEIKLNEFQWSSIPAERNKLTFYRNCPKSWPIMLFRIFSAQVTQYAMDPLKLLHVQYPEKIIDVTMSTSPTCNLFWMNWCKMKAKTVNNETSTINHNRNQKSDKQPNSRKSNQTCKTKAKRRKRNYEKGDECVLSHQWASWINM